MSNRTRRIQSRAETAVSEEEDEDLIERAVRAQAGADTALALLLERNRPWILRRCASWLGNRYDAEDVAQEVVLRVCSGLPRLERRSRFRPWVARIVDNQCKTFLARRRQSITVDHLETLIELAEATALAPVAQANVAEQVNELLVQLPRKSSQVLYLRFFRDLSLEDIAKSLGVSLPAAKMRLYRALDRFGAQYRSMEA